MNEAIQDLISQISKRMASQWVSTHGGNVEDSPFYFVFSVADLVEALGPDHDYLTNHKKLKDKPIEELTFAEVVTCLTFVVRGDRFCDGLLANEIKSGRIEKLLRRLNDVI